MIIIGNVQVQQSRCI